MLVIQLLIPIVVASTLFTPLVITWQVFKWSDTLAKAESMGLSIDHLDPEEYPTDLNVKDLTKEQVGCAEAWICANHEYGYPTSKNPKVASFNIRAPNPELGISKNPLVYNYINLHSQGWASSSTFINLEEAQQTQLFNYKLTEVDVRNEYEDRRTICDNPFSRQVLKQMANNEDLVRKPEAKMIYELIGNNVELWYNFSNTGKIPLTLVDNRLLSKYNLVSKNYPFIQRKDLTLRH